MTKSDLVAALTTRTSFSSSRAEQVVDVMFDAITKALVAGEGIEIRGLGSSTVRKYKGYIGRTVKRDCLVPCP